MADLLTSFRDFVAREKLFTKEDKLLLAGSGGIDSTVLAHLLYAEGYTFGIAHVNFQLRGADSDGDAAFVEDLARTLGAKFHLKAVDVKAMKSPGFSTQMLARSVRFNYFDKIFDDHEYGYKHLLTAHHLDDSLETFLIQTVRGRRYAGPRGISAKVGNLRRPLLGVGREEIQRFALEKGLSWREDASNATDDYLRNRIRHHLTPVLRERFGLTAPRWANTQDQLELDAQLAELGRRALREKFVARVSDDEVVIERKNSSIERVLLREVAGNLGFYPEQQRQMISIRGDRVLDSASHRVYVSAASFRFVRRSEAGYPSPASTVVERLPYFGEKVSLELVDRTTDLGTPGFQYLAPPTLPLHLRPRRNGDRFQPLGMGGKTKKVQDYFVDEKVPVWLRDRIYLLCNAEDEIMAIPGYCISEKFKVRTKSEEVLRIAWS